MTDRARLIVVKAYLEAKILSQNYVGTGHLLLGSLLAGGGATDALHACVPSLNVDWCRKELTDHPKTTQPTVARVPLPPKLRGAIWLSFVAARQLGHNFVSTEHVLLGLLDQEGGMAQVMLHEHSADFEDLRQKAVLSLTTLQVRFP